MKKVALLLVSAASLLLVPACGCLCRKKEDKPCCKKEKPRCPKKSPCSKRDRMNDEDRD